MQTWLRSGSNCRVGRGRPGKFFRIAAASLEKPNKTWRHALARWLQNTSATDQKGSVRHG
jgi:hypothetical protein